MANIKVKYIVGINGDRVEVEIFENEKIIEKETYSFGYNASYNRKFAKFAEQDYNNSIKYNWKSHYCLKPYIGDILVELFNKYNLTKEDVEYSAYYVMSNKYDTTKEQSERIMEYLYKEL